MSEQPSRYSSGSVALGRGGGTVTLVEQTSFCLSGHDGDILPGGADGIFVGDTRVLSRLELRVGGRRPEPVSVAREGEDEAVIALRTPAARRGVSPTRSRARAVSAWERRGRGRG